MVDMDEQDKQMSKDAKIMRYAMLHADWNYLRKLKRLERQSRVDYIG